MQAELTNFKGQGLTTVTFNFKFKTENRRKKIPSELLMSKTATLASKYLLRVKATLQDNPHLLFMLLRTDLPTELASTGLQPIPTKYHYSPVHCYIIFCI